MAYGGGRSDTRTDRGRGLKQVKGQGLASRHQVGTSQSGSGPWHKKAHMDWWNMPNGMKALGKFKKPTGVFADEEGG